ncbi:hypothetical protein ACFOU2_12005 [Bacillus songklensis]|uniref:Uncharacterized protein n=1 Tax=Bacillus songklensis TaxID=1069116 RepID=A0ABV8B1K0_9BACI
MYDMIIIGVGSAGGSAAILAARAKKKTIFSLYKQKGEEITIRSSVIVGTDGSQRYDRP